MPFKRKRSSRAATPARKKARGTMRKRIPAPGMVMLKRKFWLEHWVPSTASTSGFWRQYNLAINNMTDFTSLSSVFDQYKISAIKLELMPRFDSFNGQDTTDTTLPGITNQTGTTAYVSYDTYTTVTPTGTYGSTALNSFLEQGRVKRFTGLRPITIYYKPTITQNVAGTAANNFRKSTWLPTSSGGLTHYGPTIFTHDPNFSGTFGNSFDVFVTLYTMFRNPK